MRFEDVLKSEGVGFDVLIENVVPKDFSDWKGFGELKWGCDVGALDGALARPIWDLLDRGGKRWRPFLMRLCYEVVGGSGNIDEFLPLVEVIHNGTLMIDDIEDDSDLRRGKACVHKIFGNDVAINAGNAMYFLPVMKIFDSDLDDRMKIRVLKVVNEEMVKLHFGQGMDIFWHGGGSCPSENEYLQMCAFKTGTLARMAAKLGGVLGGADDEMVKSLGEFAEALGVAFQIQDDILNICPGENWGKDYGDDISEGKRTLLVIRALALSGHGSGEPDVVSKEDASDLVGILNLKTKNKVMIGEAIGILRNSGAIEYAEGVAKKLILDAWGKLDLPDGESKNKLKMFSDFVVEREI